MSDIWMEYIPPGSPLMVCRGISGCGSIIATDAWDSHLAHHDLLNETATEAAMNGASSE